jgi:hypothetical protein
MTLRMGDGPPSNIPPGLDAVAGYVNPSGIGITFPMVVAKYPDAEHLSITTEEGYVAMTGDVERGALNDWTGFVVGYCAVSDVNDKVAQFGRPRKLWTAHRDDKFGKHICGPDTCNYGGNLVTAADGTQWSNHGGAWDESVLLDNFFDFLSPPTELQKGDTMVHYTEGGQDHVVVWQDANKRTVHYYQASPGTAPPNAPANFYQWRSEVLPEPA